MSEPLQAVKADAAAGTDGVLVKLTTDDGEGDILVPPSGRWKSRANSMLNNGQFHEWARTVLAETDFDTWSELDPTNDDVEAFFKAWQAATGESRPESRASKRSSRSTPR